MQRRQLRCGLWCFTPEAPGEVALTGYNGPGGTVRVPARLAGRRVVRLEAGLFREDALPIEREGTSPDPLTAIIIPEGVRQIGAHAFAGCRSLVHAVLPASLRTIGEGAFSFCVGLRKVSLPAGLTALPPGVFEGCVSLRHIALPPALRIIGEGAFCGCWNLTTPDWPAGLESIGDYAFDGCDCVQPPDPACRAVRTGLDAFVPAELAG